MRNTALATAVAAALTLSVADASAAASTTATKAELQAMQAQMEALAARLNKLEAANTALQSENTELKALVERRDAETDYLKAQTKELREEGAVHSNEIGKLKGADWAGRIKLKGDLRIRNENIESERVVGTGDEAVLDDAANRNRMRYRARFGAEAKVSDNSRVVFQLQFGEVTKKVLLIVMVLFLIGLAASQMIAAGIIRPVARLSMAVEELGRQNWKTPIPVRGSDELARLASSFNQMALALQEREASLSQGNRDLFLLHSAGLDLMESLDLAELLGRTAARAGDLIKADTTTIAAVDRGTRTLQYIGAEGSRALLLQQQELPLEAGGIYNWLATYGTPLLIPDARNDFRLDGEQMAALGVRSLIAVPLWSSNSMIAVLTAVNKTGGEVFDRHDLRLCTVFANIAGAALQNGAITGTVERGQGQPGGRFTLRWVE